ncbi:hypothetical protein Tco_0026506 [Tanacetum coccineum]
MILIDVLGLLIGKDELIILIAALMSGVMGLPISEDELMILVGVLMIGVKGLLIGEEAEPFCSRAPCLKVNLSKIRPFGIGVDLTEVEVVASSLKCSHDSIPFLYLSLPVGKNMQYCNGWLDVIRRVQDRLSFLKARSFSIGGRLTLIKSVLESIHLYYLSIFKAPLKVIKLVESLRRWFFWGFKDDQKGKHTLWSDVISSIDYIDVPDVPFSSSFSKKVSNGFDTMLWKDVWCSEGIRFIDHFPRLYAFESNKDCKVNTLTKLIQDKQLAYSSLDPQVNLIARAVNIPSSLCPFSEADEESLDHYLIKCPKIILRVAWTDTNPCRRFLNCRFSNIAGTTHCNSFYWIDPELTNQWYKTQMFEIYLTLNPKERHLYYNQITAQNLLENLQNEFEVYQHDYASLQIRRKMELEVNKSKKKAQLLIKVDDYSPRGDFITVAEEDKCLMIRLILWGHEHTKKSVHPTSRRNSSDPFNLYNLLNNRDKGEANSWFGSSYSFPTWINIEREFQPMLMQGRSSVMGNYKFEYTISEAVRNSGGVMVDGEWVDDSCRVKEEFRLHFANRFRAPAANRCKLNYTFPNRLSSDQLDMLESPISRDKVRNAVWGYGENKSP